VFQVDAFTTRIFRGDPAAVVVLDAFPEDATLQAIAAEHSLSETAFLVPTASGYDLRWFTPVLEVPLCGHATLASAAVVLERLEPGRSQVVFATASGPLSVRRAGEGYAMNFPARPCEPVAAPAGLAEALGAPLVEVHANAFNVLALLSGEDAVRAVAPDQAALERIDFPGVIVTAAGEPPHAIVSRYFAPRKGIAEDPVTGGAHCTLAPFWASRLGKDELLAWQASPRGGELMCRVRGDRVELEGACAFYLEGTISAPSSLRRPAGRAP
jgi:PhzF family phenazine biosynthesis protein